MYCYVVLGVALVIPVNDDRFMRSVQIIKLIPTARPGARFTKDLKMMLR